MTTQYFTNFHIEVNLNGTKELVRTLHAGMAGIPISDPWEVVVETDTPSTVVFISAGTIPGTIPGPIGGSPPVNVAVPASPVSTEAADTPSD